MRFVLQISALLLASITSGFAQDEFSLLWETKLAFYPKKISDHSTSGSVYVASSDDQIVALQGKDGSTKWGFKFKDRFKVGSFKIQYWNRDAGVIILANKNSKEPVYSIDENTGEILWQRSGYDGELGTYSLSDMLALGFSLQDTGQILLRNASLECVHLRTGRIIWTSRLIVQSKDKTIFVLPIGTTIGVSHGPDQYQIRTDFVSRKTGEVTDSIQGILQNQLLHADTVLIGQRKALLSITYPHDLNSDASGTRLLTLQAVEAETGKTIWRKRFDLQIFVVPLSREPQIRIEVDDQFIMVSGQSLTVFDLAIGKLLWSSKFQQALARGPSIITGKISVYKNVSDFAADGSKLYFSSLEESAIIKKDLPGNAIDWKVPLRSGDVVPRMVIQDTLLCVQIGGRIEYEGMTQPRTNSMFSFGGVSFFSRTFKYRETEFMGSDYRIEGINMNTGEVKWSFGNDDMRLTNMFVDGSDLVVGEKGSCFRIQSRTGQIESRADLASEGLGEVIHVQYDSNLKKIVADAERGLVLMEPTTLVIESSIFTGKNYGHFYMGDDLFVWTEDSWVEPKGICRIDLNQKKSIGRFRSAEVISDPKELMSTDGKRIFTRTFQRIKCLKTE